MELKLRFLKIRVWSLTSGRTPTDVLSGTACFSAELVDLKCSVQKEAGRSVLSVSVSGQDTLILWSRNTITLLLSSVSFFFQVIVGKGSNIYLHILPTSTFVLCITSQTRIGRFVEQCCLNAIALGQRCPTENLVSLLGSVFWTTVLADGCFYSERTNKNKLTEEERCLGNLHPEERMSEA